MIANGAVPLITIPTRATDKTSTIIDHIITNDVKHHISPAVLEVNLTDHYPILCAVKQSKPLRKVKVSESFHRDQSKLVADSFCEDLQNKLHDYFVQQPSLCNSNYNSLFNKFASIVTETIDIHAPLTKLSCTKIKRRSKPWITKGILISIEKKRKMFKTHFLANDENKNSLFKKYANRLTKIKTSPKRNYYTSKIKEDQDNPRKVWNTIRSVLPQKSNHSHENSSAIKLDGHETTDPQLSQIISINFFALLAQTLPKIAPTRN